MLQMSLAEIHRRSFSGSRARTSRTRGIRNRRHRPRNHRRFKPQRETRKAYLWTDACANNAGIWIDRARTYGRTGPSPSTRSSSSLAARLSSILTSNASSTPPDIDSGQPTDSPEIRIPLGTEREGEGETLYGGNLHIFSGNLRTGRSGSAHKIGSQGKVK